LGDVQILNFTDRQYRDIVHFSGGKIQINWSCYNDYARK